MPLMALPKYTGVRWPALNQIAVELRQRGAHQVHFLVQCDEPRFRLRRWRRCVQVAAAQVVGAGEEGGGRGRPAR